MKKLKSIKMADEEERRRFREIIRTFFPPEPDLAILEEAAELFAKRVPKPREVITKTLDRDQAKFIGAQDLISVRGRGKLREFMVRAKGKNFRVIILADGLKKLDRTYDELDVISEYLDFIDAFEVDGEYIIHLKEVSWISDFLLTLLAEEEIVFLKIFAVWDEIL